MAMAGRIKSSFHHKVFYSLLSFCWVLVGAFAVFQYHRETTFRSELMNMELQMHNERIIDDMEKGESIASIASRIGTPLPELRLTLVNNDGVVVYDSMIKLRSLIQITITGLKFYKQERSAQDIRLDDIQKVMTVTTSIRPL